MRARRWIAIAAAAVVVLAACSSDNKTTTATASSSAAAGGGQTVSVQIDASATASPAVAFLDYFPSEVTVHAGDTIDFSSNFRGEPHSVTFGSLVDEGLAKVDPNAQNEPPELAKVPLMVPEGAGDAIQAGAQPCFLASGDPPASDACTADQQKQPEFTGTQTYYNSGFLADGDHFKVTLAKDIKAGKYRYFCNLHRAVMAGNVTVIAADAKAQTADEVKQAGEAALADATAKIKPTIDAIKAGTLPPFIPTATPGSVISGGGAQDQPQAAALVFGPDKVNVKVGDTVTWTVIGPHTVSFGAPLSVRTFIAKAPDGAVHLNPDAFVPSGGAGQSQGPPGGDPNAPPGPPTPIDGGSYDGTGFHSSGLVLSFPPALFSYSVKFTKAGTFEYVCLLHPQMTGTVNVA